MSSGVLRKREEHPAILNPRLLDGLRLVRAWAGHHISPRRRDGLVRNLRGPLLLWLSAPGQEV